MRKILLSFVLGMFSLLAYGQQQTITFQLSGLQPEDYSLVYRVECHYATSVPGGSMQTFHEFLSWNESGQATIYISLPSGDATKFAYTIYSSNFDELRGEVAIANLSDPITINPAEGYRLVTLDVKDYQENPLENVQLDVESTNYGFQYSSFSGRIYLKPGEYYYSVNAGVQDEINYFATPVNTITISSEGADPVISADYSTAKKVTFNMVRPTGYTNNLNFTLRNVSNEMKAPAEFDYYIPENISSLDVYMFDGTFAYRVQGELVPKEDEFTVTTNNQIVQIDMSGYKKITFTESFGNENNDPQYVFEGEIIPESMRNNYHLDFSYDQDTYIYSASLYMPADIGTFIYNIHCRHINNYKNSYFPYRGTVNGITADMNVTLPFSSYNTVTFKVQEPYSFNNYITVFTTHQSSADVVPDGTLYAANGQYNWDVTVTDGTIELRPVSPQEFTVTNGANEAEWVVNLSDYSKVTFEVKDKNNVAVSNAYINAKGTYQSFYTSTDETGKATIYVAKDTRIEYTVEYTDDDDAFFSKSGNFFAQGTENTISVSFQDFIQVDFTINDAGLFYGTSTVELDIESGNYEVSFDLTENDGSYTGTIFLPSGVYRWDIGYYGSSSSFVFEPQLFVVNQTPVQVNYSFENYHAVTFVVNHDLGSNVYYDLNIFKNGMRVENTDYDVIHMPDGEYAWSVAFYENAVTPQQTFTVAGSDITETMNFVSTNNGQVVVKLIDPNNIIQNNFAVSFYSGQNEVSYVWFDSAGEKTVSLPVGDYTYSSYGAVIGDQAGTFSVSQGSNQLTIDLTNYQKVNFTFKDQTSNDLDVYDLYLMDGENIIGYYELSSTYLYLPQGSYTFKAIMTGYRSATKTITVSNQEQDVDFVLTQENLYNIIFVISDKYGNPVQNALVNVPGLGSKNTGQFGEVTFFDATVTGDLSYEITHASYTKVQGVIRFDDIKGSDEFYNCYIMMTDLSVGLEDTGSKTSFTVYPVPAQDFIIIEPANKATGNWNMQMFSLSGMQVMQKQINIESKEPVNVSNLQSGMYFIRLSNNDEVVRLTIIKK